MRVLCLPAVTIRRLNPRSPRLNDGFVSGRSFALAATATAIIAALALVFLLFRALSGRRLRLPRNGRTRPVRLGIVDAFDLGRRRQLVIVRRDNVEHLLMIGGPNDLLIESQFLRSDGREPRLFRDAKQRDKELRERDLRESPQIEAAGSWPSALDPGLPVSPQIKDVPLPGLSDFYPVSTELPEESIAAHAPPFLSPASRPQVLRGNSKRGLSGTAGGQAAPSQDDYGASTANPQKARETARNSGTRLSRPVTTSWLRSSARRQKADAPGHAAPAHLSRAGDGEAPDPRPDLDAREPAGPQVAPTAAVAGRPVAVPTLSTNDGPQGSADSLEQEMARILGRGPG
jgi:flagellar protein FliO/FliZ